MSVKSERTRTRTEIDSSETARVTKASYQDQKKDTSRSTKEPRRHEEFAYNRGITGEDGDSVALGGNESE